MGKWNANHRSEDGSIGKRRKLVNIVPQRMCLLGEGKCIE